MLITNWDNGICNFPYSGIPIIKTIAINIASQISDATVVIIKFDK